MNELLKESLVEQFRAHLDTLDDDAELETMADAEPSPTPMWIPGPTSIPSTSRWRRCVPKSGPNSRLVKDTLDLVRGVVERAETERARLAELEREAALLRPLLIDLIEVRDRLAAGVAGPSPATAAPRHGTGVCCAAPTRPPTPGGKGCG